MFHFHHVISKVFPIMQVVVIGDALPDGSSQRIFSCSVCRLLVLFLTRASSTHNLGNGAFPLLACEFELADFLLELFDLLEIDGRVQIKHMADMLLEKTEDRNNAFLKMNATQG
jgi:hypothetical protein